jgi:hypothetical protein
VDQISAVGVWDTVGAMGLPIYAGGGQRLDAFQFADTKLSPKVQHGFQAVALDERRKDFMPTLWEPREGVLQVLFPGAHGDVGGGYPTSQGESGLSDGALLWMQGQLALLGLRFNAAWLGAIQPLDSGTAHQPWAKAPWTLPGVAIGPRSFPDQLAVDPSVAKRRAAGPVVAEPGTPPAPYNPANLP